MAAKKRGREYRDHVRALVIEHQSTGGAAKVLGVSQQAVHELVTKDRPDEPVLVVRWAEVAPEDRMAAE